MFDLGFECRLRNDLCIVGVEVCGQLTCQAERPPGLFRGSGKEEQRVDPLAVATPLGWDHDPSLTRSDHQVVIVGDVEEGDRCGRWVGIRRLDPQGPGLEELVVDLLPID